jgi:hypothetical protein
MRPSTGSTISLCGMVLILAAYLSPATAFTTTQCLGRNSAGLEYCESKPFGPKGSIEYQEKASCNRYVEQRFKNCMANATNRKK